MGQHLRRLLSVITALVVIAASTVSSPSASGRAAPAQCVKAGSARGAQTSETALSEAVARLTASGLSGGVLEDRLASDWCLDRLSGTSPGSPGAGSFSGDVGADARHSEPADVRIHNVSLFYERQENRYYAVGSYTWHTDTYAWDESETWCTPDPVGGLDGVGIRVKGPEPGYEHVGSALTTWGAGYLDGYRNDFGVHTRHVQAGDGGQGNAKVTEWGVTFQVQDHVVGLITESGYCLPARDGRWDFNMYGGSIVHAFNRLAPGPCWPAQAYMVYGHTYDDFTVTGFQAGKDNFGVTWLVENKSWEAGPLTSNSITICQNVYGGAPANEVITLPPPPAEGRDEVGYLDGLHPTTTGPSAPGTAVDNAGGEPHVFATGSNRRLKHWWWSGSTWEFHEMPGPTITGSPAVTKDAHVYARGTNGRLQHWFWNVDAWAQHEMIGPDIVGSPYATNDGHIYATGANGRLQHWFWNVDHWAHHEMIGGSINGSPSAVVMEAPHVFATGANGRLLHWWWSHDSGSWLYQEMEGPTITGRPTATPDAHVYARGTNSKLQHWFWTGSGWAQHEMTGPAIAGSPTAATHDAHIYATGANGLLQHWFWDVDHWVHHQMSGDTTLIGSPSATVLEAPHIFATASDRRLLHWWWSSQVGDWLYQEFPETY